MKDQVINVIARGIGIDSSDITEKHSIMNDLGADSLTIVEIVLELEDEFEVDIPDEDAENFKTIGDVVKFIEDNA
jgi:acyl carrier protein